MWQLFLGPAGTLTMAADDSARKGPNTLAGTMEEEEEESVSYSQFSYSSTRLSDIDILRHEMRTFTVYAET